MEHIYKIKDKFNNEGFALFYNGHNFDMIKDFCPYVKMNKDKNLIIEDFTETDKFVKSMNKGKWHSYLIKDYNGSYYFADEYRFYSNWEIIEKC